MKVKMLVHMEGMNVTRNVGDVLEIENAEAVRLIEAGYAEVVRAEKIEKAIAIDENDELPKVKRGRKVQQ